MSMVERATKAAFAKAAELGEIAPFDGVGDPLPRWDDESYQYKRERWLVIIRAAIEAMREPTLAMETAGDAGAVYDAVECRTTLEVWQAMIDAALKDPTP